MVHPGVIVAVSFGLVATGVVLYTIFKEEFHGLLESPSSVPGGGRHSQSRRKGDGSNDGDSFEGRTTGRGNPHYGYELRSRRVQSENEKNDEEDDDDKGDEESLLNKKLQEVERREQELAEKMARLDRQEQLLAEREERLKQQQQQQQLANSVSTIAVSSSHTSPLSPPSSLDNFQHAQPCSSNSNNSNMVSSSTRDNDIIRQHHPLEESPSTSLAFVESALLPALSNQADDIQQQHLDDQRNPFEESSIYMDASSSALIRDDADTYHQQAQTQNQQQQPSSQGYLHHSHHISADVDRDGDEITSPRAGTSSDPEWVDADVDSDMQSNFSDYDDWSSSSARSP